MEHDTELINRASALEVRISLLEGRVAVCESRIESEKGTLVRMESRLYDQMNGIKASLEANRTNTDSKYADLTDSLNKLARLVWIGCGGVAGIGILFKVLDYLKHP